RPLSVTGGWVMNQSFAVFVALRDSGMRSVEDLKGKRISLGSPESSANVLGELILQAHGLNRGGLYAHPPGLAGVGRCAERRPDRCSGHGGRAALPSHRNPCPAEERCAALY